RLGGQHTGGCSKRPFFQGQTKLEWLLKWNYRANQPLQQNRLHCHWGRPNWLHILCCFPFREKTVDFPDLWLWNQYFQNCSGSQFLFSVNCSQQYRHCHPESPWTAQCCPIPFRLWFEKY